MQTCNCPMMTKGELNALVQSDDGARREEAIAYLVSMLTSGDAAERRHCYELFGDGVAAALFRPCLNYGSLARGFTDPLVDIVVRTVETWAALRREDSREQAEVP